MRLLPRDINYHHRFYFYGALQVVVEVEHVCQVVAVVGPRVRVHLRHQHAGPRVSAPALVPGPEVTGQHGAGVKWSIVTAVPGSTIFMTTCSLLI